VLQVRRLEQNIAFNAETVQFRVARLALLEPKNQIFGSFERRLAPKFLFGYFATFWLFCNFFVSQIFLGEEVRVAR